MVELVEILDGVTSSVVCIADGIETEVVCIHKKDTHCGQHSHVWDHVTSVVRGAVEMWADGKFVRVLREMDAVVIPAFVKHYFVALEDSSTYVCVHNISRTGKIDVAALHKLEEVR